MSKLKLTLVSVGTAVVGFVGAVVANAQTLSSSTLGTAVDSVSSTWYDYFLTFLAHAWPFLLGASVIVGIVLLALRLIRRIFHG